MTVQITDKEIYKRLEDLENRNTEEHSKILRMIDGYKYQVKKLYWITAGCIGVSISIFFILIQIMLSK